MKAAWAIAVVCAACTRSEPKPPPDQGTAQSTSTVTVPAAGGAVGKAPEGSAERKSGQAVLLGTLHRMGTKVCTGRESEEWKDLHLRAGLIRLEGNTQGLEALRGKPVIVFGTVTARGTPVLTRTEGECPPYQSRSDWIDAPDGTILRRDDGPGIQSFNVSSGRSFQELSARIDADRVVIELENPLEVALENATLRVHYEGCYGKPLTHREARVLGTLAPRAKKSATVPTIALATMGSRKDLRHVPVSVQVEAKAPDVFFDLDVDLNGLGVVVDCPKR